MDERKPPETECSWLPIAVRALTEETRERKSFQKNQEAATLWPKEILVFDTETTVDAEQRLNFASYWWGNPDTQETIDEGIIFGDDLPQRYPAGMKRLQNFVDRLPVSAITGQTTEIKLRSRLDFAQNVFFKAAYKSRVPVVGFNLPFDITRLAVNYGIARGNFFGGGFSLRIFDYLDENGKYREHLYRPRICIKHLDSKRSFIGFRRPSKVDPDNVGEFFPGYFLDLKTLGFALTNEGGGLAKMCEVFGVKHGKKKAEKHGVINKKYIEYNRRDLLATFELFKKLRADFDLHPINLEPWKAYSPASIGKKYLLGMNLVPPRRKFRNISAALLAKTESAFFGGRAECRIRGVVPAVYCDFLSMYPTVNALTGLWDLLTAAKLKVVDATKEFREFLAKVTKEDCFKPGTWKQLNVFVRLSPDQDILPVRARYGEADDALNIGINKLSSRQPLYYAGPDVLASKLLTGKPPKIERAIRLVPVGRQAGLRPIKIRGTTLVDPARQDFFCALVEEKERAKNSNRPAEESFFKVAVNSTSYGIYAEMNAQELSKPRTVLVNGLNRRFKHRTKKPEELGEFCFPPIAAIISSGARLALALLERCVGDEGGCYAYCDTDSMAIVATEEGGMIPLRVGNDRPHRTEMVKALSWKTVDQIVQRFESLNTLDKSTVPGSILKIEKENSDGKPPVRRQLYGCFLASKRYALFNFKSGGEIKIRKFSEHGLGHLLNPADPKDPPKKWIEEIWRQIIFEELGRPRRRPAWFNRPAISQQTITSPHLMKPFIPRRKRVPYIDRIKPMNFVLAAQVKPFGHPSGANAKKFHLTAPYTDEPDQWLNSKWTEAHSLKAYRISTTAGPTDSIVRVKSIGDVYDEYKIHPEAKSGGPDGGPCGPHARGILHRRSVSAAYVKLIGKESNKIEESELGEISDQGDVLEEYFDPIDDPWFSLVVPILKLMKRDELAKLAGVGPRSIQALRNGRWKPSKKTRAVLTRAAGDYARGNLGRNIRDDLCACAAYIGNPE